MFLNSFELQVKHTAGNTCTGKLYIAVNCMLLHVFLVSFLKVLRDKGMLFIKKFPWVYLILRHFDSDFFYGSLHQIKVTDAFGKYDAGHLRRDEMSVEHADRGSSTLTPRLEDIFSRILHLPPPPLLNGLQGNPHSFSQHPPVSTCNYTVKLD